MDLQIRNPGFDYMIKTIMDFQTKDTSDFWSAPLYHFYPQLDRAHVDKLPPQERKAYIGQILRQVYNEQKGAIDNKVLLYAAHWKNCKEQITAALSDAFDLDCGTIFNDMICNVSMNPIEPRFLRTHSFDIFYWNSERGAIGESIHEIIHFVWFYVWNRLFGDSYDDYEAPSLKWILSEMAVEPVMRDERLSSLNPYFPRENGGCVYPYFFTMKVDGRLILDTLADMYRSMHISDFMKASYTYCQVHEAEIRQHIKAAEQ